MSVKKNGGMKRLKGFDASGNAICETNHAAFQIL